MVDFTTQALSFLDRLFIKVDKHLVIEPHWDIDHLCYRTESAENYEYTKNLFAGFSQLLIESPVNGRMISTFKLKNPIVFRNWKIDLVEVPAPKPGKLCKKGFEHIEVVCDADLFDLEKKLSTLELDRGGLRKKFNKELEVVFGDENIKFHNYSLESVIRLEKKLKIFSVMNSAELAPLFREHNVFVAGTHPLDLENDKSDLDLLIMASKKEVLRLLSEQFSPDRIKHGKNTFNINVNGFAVQIYLSEQTPTFQQSFQHFQVEEKILKYALSLDLVALKSLRQTDTKTESAFAQILNLKGDEYDVLEKMNHLPIHDLDRLLNPDSILKRNK